MSYTKPLSYSSMKLFKECPRRWAERYIEGVKEPSGPAAERGTEIHAVIEQFFLAPTGTLGGRKELLPWGNLLNDLRTAGGCHPEAKVAMNQYWEPVDFDSPDAVFRGVLDLLVNSSPVIDIYDWKTGRIYPEHAGQARAYTALVSPAEKYNVYMVYIDQPRISHLHTFDNTMRMAFIAMLLGDIEQIREAKEYPATPNDKCKWCALSWRNGGKCNAPP